MIKFLYEIGVLMFIERDWIGISSLIGCILLFIFFIGWRIHRVVKIREYQNNMRTSISYWLDEEGMLLSKNHQQNRKIIFEELLIFSDSKNGISREFLEVTWKWLIDTNRIKPCSAPDGGYMIFSQYDWGNLEKDREKWERGTKREPSI